MGKSALQRDPRFARARHVASSGLLLRSSALLCPALLQLLPQAVRLDQHILRISKLVLRSWRKPAKAGPAPLLRTSRSTSSKLTSARFSYRVGCGHPLKAVEEMHLRLHDFRFYPHFSQPCWFDVISNQRIDYTSGISQISPSRDGITDH